MGLLGYEVDFLYCKDDFFSPISEAAIQEMRKLIGVEHFHFYNNLEIKTFSKYKRKLRNFIETHNLSQQIVIPYSADELYDSTLGKRCDRLIKKNHYDVVWLEYIWLSRIFDDITDRKILKVIDTHDIMTKRYQQYLKLSQSPEFFYTTKRQEQKCLNRADVVIAIQNREERYFRTLTKKKTKVVTIGDCIEKNESKLIDDKSICFIGAANTFNVQGILWFLKEVFPIIQKRMPQVRLYIAGRVCDMLPDSDDYIKCGVVDHIQRVYEKTRIVINPVLQGTGLNIKSIEAIANMKPLVSTSVGVKGLGSELKCFKVADDPERFAEMTVRLLISDEECENLIYNCDRFIDGYNRKNEYEIRKIMKWCAEKHEWHN